MPRPPVILGIVVHVGTLDHRTYGEIFAVLLEFLADVRSPQVDQLLLMRRELTHWGVPPGAFVALSG